MENIIHAETKGTVKKVMVKEGDTIKASDLMIKLE